MFLHSHHSGVMVMTAYRQKLILPSRSLFGRSGPTFHLPYVYLYHTLNIFDLQNITDLGRAQARCLLNGTTLFPDRPPPSPPTSVHTNQTLITNQKLIFYPGDQVIHKKISTYDRTISPLAPLSTTLHSKQTQNITCAPHS